MYYIYDTTNPFHEQFQFKYIKDLFNVYYHRICMQTIALFYLSIPSFIGNSVLIIICRCWPICIKIKQVCKNYGNGKKTIE